MTDKVLPVRIQLMQLACCVLIAMAGPEGVAAAADDVPKLALATTWFHELDQLCRADGGQLWGISLAGPVMIVDPQTRAVFANQADAEGVLHPEGTLFVGTLPPNVPIANTAQKWAGVYWTQLMWPLPEEDDSRHVLMMHESWHRVQEQIGLPASNPSNGHLNTFDGRLWLQLEWRALERALRATDESGRAAVEDALLFRRERHRLAPEAAVQECALEAAEGLAEYTGVRLSGMSAKQQRTYLAERIDTLPAQLSTFNRSFAYLTGPAYGLLLDATGQPWRKGLTVQNDLGLRLQERMQMALSGVSAEELTRRADQYGGAALRQSEMERETARRARHAAWHKQFLEDPVLVLPLDKIQMTFDPRNVEAAGEMGTYYPTITISDRWGKLTVTEGALVASDFKTVIVTAPADRHVVPLSGTGWNLELDASWTIVEGDRPGCLRATPRAK